MIQQLLTGAIVINEDLGDDMDMIQPIHLGKCLKVITDNENTNIRWKSNLKKLKI